MEARTSKTCPGYTHSRSFRKDRSQQVHALDVTEIDDCYSFAADCFRFDHQCLGTRRIEAAVGTAATRILIEQDRMISRLNQELKAYSTSAGNGLDLKVNKMKDQVADVSKQYNRILDKLVRSPPSAPPKRGQLNVGTTVPVQIHVLDPEIQDADYYAKKANLLKELAPESVHVLVWNENVVVALDQKKHPKLHAGKVLKSVLDKVGGKGGGQPQMARGRFASEASLQQLYELVENP